MHRLLHQRGGLLHLLQSDVHGAGDVDQHAPCAVDRGLQQGGGNGHLGGLLGLALAGRAAHAHVGQTCVLHNGGHVREVQVDEPGVADQVGDGLHRLTQHVVRDLKSVGKGDLLVGGVFQTLVGNDDQRVHLAPQLLNALFRLGHAAVSLEAEGLGHHAHGQNACLPGDLSHHGCRAGAGAAAHAGGDEHHVGVFQRLGHLVAALLRGLAAHIRVGTRTLTAGQLLADLNFIGSAGGIQRLLVCVDCDKINALRATAYHAVDHVVSAAAYAHDLDADNVLRAGFQSKSHVCSSCHNLYENDGLSPGKCYILYCITNWRKRQV